MAGLYSCSGIEHDRLRGLSKSTAWWLPQVIIQQTVLGAALQQALCATKGRRWEQVRKGQGQGDEKVRRSCRVGINY